MNQLHRTSPCLKVAPGSADSQSLLARRGSTVISFRVSFPSNKTGLRNHTKSHEQNSYASCISWIVLPGKEIFQIGTPPATSTASVSANRCVIFWLIRHAIRRDACGLNLFYDQEFHNRRCLRHCHGKFGRRCADAYLAAGGKPRV